MSECDKTTEPKAALEDNSERKQISATFELAEVSAKRVNKCVSSEEKNQATKLKKDEQEKDESKNDKLNMILLVFLYMLQGIQSGIAYSIPMILQNRGVSYDDQAQFSIVTVPYMIKIICAPIIDSVSSPKFGKRKSCIVPVQYILGLTLFIISVNIDNWMGNPSEGEKPNINMLTIMFLFSFILAAIQDVAVDGWALTMLSRKNVGHTSTCLSVGMNMGHFLGHVLFITLDSADFCNKWIRSNPQPTGIMTIADALCFWAAVYVISTTLLAFFKKEELYKFDESKEEIKFNVKQSYVILWEILKLKPVQRVAALLLTTGFVWAVSEAVAPLKFLEYGVPREKFAMLDIPLIPIHICLPFLLNRFVVSKRPMNLFLYTIPFWMMNMILTAILLYFTPTFVKNYELPMNYLILLLLLHVFHQIMEKFLNIALVAFYAKISDQRCASTYMTLLLTMSFLPYKLYCSFAIFMVDRLTWTRCFLFSDTDSSKMVCEVFIDGFYVETAICTVWGIVWFIWAKKEYTELQNLDRKEWLLDNSDYYK